MPGLRVTDFSWAWAGPYATELLAFLGAEVIKVESTKRIDLPIRKQSRQDVNKCLPPLTVNER